ncbi:MAG: protein kinase [Xenococcus sp. (in: cyanobacteria)]
MDFSKKEDNPKSRELGEDFARRVLQNRYRLINKLYEEEFEIVYLAESQDTSVPTNCLIQQFTPQYSSQAQLAAAKQLFNREASILKNLGTHPQIPTVYDYFEIEGQFFVVQEFILGQSLQEELSESEPYNETEIIEFLNKILPVLQFIHEHNYIHRDIKPSHLMGNYVDQKIYLINFYSIKEKINPQNLDITGQFVPHITVGTQGYIPIEQHLGKPEFCSDLYALGIVTIQALTKVDLPQLQYDENNNPIWHNLLANPTDFSPQLLDIIDTMVLCNHQQRYQSAIAVMASLKQLDSSQKVTENTVIVENSDSKTYATERTLILNDSGVSARNPEQTLIMQNDELDSTRIINYHLNNNHNNNSQKNENKFSWKFMTIIGVALISIIIIFMLFIIKNNQNSEPQNSSLPSLSL